ncbi:MAG: alpha/beta hydrolase [Opitutaceae bacterium]|nr:alpha/beta hydrolase [Cytophagales bacterium]
MYRSYSKFSHLSSTLSYSVFGTGEKVLLVFHGYGHTHKNMKGIEESLSEEYKIFSFDLFFHGFSEWNYDDSMLTKDHWSSILNAFLTENNIGKFSLLGFSLGGKVALSITEIMPYRIEKLFLIAPDGLKHNIWYDLATSKVLKSIFKLTIIKPQIFETAVKVLNKLKLLDKSTLRFSSTQMNSKEKRRRVYFSWTVYKGLTPDIEKITEFLNRNKNQVVLYLGKYDRIIKPETVLAFTSKLKFCKVHQLNSGHNNLLDEVSNLLNKELSKI